MNPKEHNWLTRLTTMLVAFCAFILTDIYRDFKKVRDEVQEHKYQLRALNDKYEDVSYDISYVMGSYQKLMNDKTVISAKPFNQ